ncbi:MAG: tetratricopeptide repeat protein [Planctomycetaceae bacterium]|jgi:DNA-directed RNA polymerase subunit alpha|nr:tetratricopeptide repeat protein [Planctomycetaceae bacterium]
MVAQTTEFDLKQAMLIGSSFGPREVENIRVAVRSDTAQFDRLRDAVIELESQNTRDELAHAGRVRLGIGYYLLGDYENALQVIKKGDGGALALFYQAKINFMLEGYDEAIKGYDLAQKAGYNADECTLGKAEVYRNMLQPEKSLEQLDKLSGAIEQTAEYLYQRGVTVAALGQTEEAIRLYERAVAADKKHTGALFGLALESERRGNDESALELYKQAASNFPTNVGTLLNLGLLYEDLEQFQQAMICYQRILDSFPDNKRARLFFKDAKASSEMNIDEDALKRRDRHSQILNLPVSDFELSVRSRNCLRLMGINTLGDLCQHTEQELLASKNFGENSLNEIREMLTLKGLKLGQYASEKQLPEPIQIESLSPAEQQLLARPVTDLNLSVRAKKCMNRLNIQTIGELVSCSAEQLLDCKNFGVTSLTEIREKLVNFNIKLRGE